jgi:two-component system, NarL family, nitrate/nitrite response regulator NarL
VPVAAAVRVEKDRAMADAIRVVIADDHELLRSEIHRDLTAAGVDVCAEAEDADAAVAAVLAREPDLCLLDVSMPGGGIQAAAEIKARRPLTPVVMMSAAADDETLARALGAGATGHLLKDIDGRDLGDALVRAAAGEHVGPPAFARLARLHGIAPFRTR